MARLILHVDDDPQLPESVVSVLEADGYRWIRTADPEQVMRLVEEQEVALVLMEVDLAGCDGLDLLAGILSARAGEVPVLVLTRQPCDSSVHGEVIALGVNHFLSKPVLRAQLLSSIREVALPPAATAAAAPAATPAADLSGELADSPVPELVARLRRRGASGVLKLQQRGTVVRIQLRNGTPICAGSSRWGGAGAKSEDDAEAEIFETFDWEEGVWEFFAGRRLPPETSCELSRDPAGLLLRGVLQASLESVRERLRKRATLYVSVSGSCEDPIEGVELTSRQSTLLEELNGQASLGDLLASLAFEERVLYGLWVAGRIDLHAVPTLDLTDLHGEDSAPALELEPEREPEPEPELELERAPEPARVRERVRVAPKPRAERARSRRPSRAPQLAQPTVTGDTREALSQTLRELAQQVMASDDFDALGVPVDVSEEQLREAYRRRLGEIPRQALDGADFELRARAERIRDRVESAYAHLEDPESRRAYALLRKEERQDREAGSVAERALEGERWFRKGRGHLEQRRYEQAAEAFGMAAHLDPKEGEYVAHLGYALFLSKPGDKVVQREAMEHVANGIKRSPTREMSYIYLGRILKARGDEQAAFKLFRRALRIKPDSHPALQEIRVLEMRKSKSKDKGKGILSRLLGS